jgi:hypothetical protein
MSQCLDVVCECVSGCACVCACLSVCVCVGVGVCGVWTLHGLTKIPNNGGTHTHTHMCRHVNTYMHTNTYTHKWRHAHIHIRTNTQTCICTHAYTHTHTHTHANTQGRMFNAEKLRASYRSHCNTIVYNTTVTPLQHHCNTKTVTLLL